MDRSLFVYYDIFIRDVLNILQTVSWMEKVFEEDIHYIWKCHFISCYVFLKVLLFSWGI